MKEPNWPKVLTVLYNAEDSMYRQINGDLSESNNLVEEPGLSPKEVENSLSFLRDMGLVTQEGAGQEPDGDGGTRSTHIEYALTETGFDVAHEREIEERQQNLMETQNEATGILASFTVILGAAALIQTVTAVINSPYPKNVYLSVVFIILLISIWYTKDDWMPTR